MLSGIEISNFFVSDHLKVIVGAEILPRDFLQTPGKYYL